MANPFDKFLIKFTKSFKDRSPAIKNLMANVFSMRMIGNKTHGDLAEIALTEYVNEFVDGYTAEHIGKDTFRAKEYEEDVSVTDERTKITIPVSIKAYGEGDLQFSTNKDGSMFKYLSGVVGKGEITDLQKVRSILRYRSFTNINQLYVLPFIYNERVEKDGRVKGGSFKIIIFNIAKAYQSARKVKYVGPGGRRKHPVYRFFTNDDDYIFEVRYGYTDANALQRGLWTHTENAKPYFNEILNGLYEINQPLLKLMSKILVSSQEKHKQILKMFYKI